ncbi:MAG: SDR family oxidoreductase [Alphaproteobacteria bacterium]|nr:SDR family oxidoreductase [Alphaproteobacteria bacterium]
MTTEKTQDLVGKTALVTGSTSGIGLAIAQEMLARGANVMFTGKFMHKDPAEVEKQRAEFTATLDAIKASYPNRAIGFQESEAGDYNSNVALVKATAALGGGKIDILVNNAGVQVPVPVDQVEPERWKNLIDVNLNGAFYATHAAVPFMKAAGGGNIINVTSVHAHVVSPGRAAYCASKFGLRALTETAAIDLAPHNIAVNTVSPAFVKTPLAQIQIDQMVAQGKTLEEAEAWRLQLQDGKWIPIEELASKTADIAARKSGLKTGADLLLDNGYVEKARGQTKALSSTGIAFFDKATRAAMETFNRVIGTGDLPPH